MVILRELTGGLYFGAQGAGRRPRVSTPAPTRAAEVERIARRAFELARTRRGTLCSVDKAERAGVVQALARASSLDLAADYPDVELPTSWSTRWR